MKTFSSSDLVLLEDCEQMQLFLRASGPAYQAFKRCTYLDQCFLWQKFILKNSQKYGVHFRHRDSHQDIFLIIFTMNIK